MKHNSNFKHDLEWGKQGEVVVGKSGTTKRTSSLTT